MGEIRAKWKALGDKAKQNCSILNITRRPKISFPLVHVGLHLVSYNGEMKRLGTGYTGLIKAVLERGKKTNENSLAAKVSMDMKGTPSPVVNEKKGKKEPSFDSSTSPLTNKEKDRKEQSLGHLTSPLKANHE
ncbi:hypothetical protein C3L33_02938, partial [Rhododendron williamsianum]